MDDINIEFGPLCQTIEVTNNSVNELKGQILALESYLSKHLDTIVSSIYKGPVLLETVNGNQELTYLVGLTIASEFRLKGRSWGECSQELPPSAAFYRQKIQFTENGYFVVPNVPCLLLDNLGTEFDRLPWYKVKSLKALTNEEFHEANMGKLADCWRKLDSIHTVQG